MNVPTTGWSNKRGTSDRSCACGGWNKHWTKFSSKTWPSSCSVANCNNSPTLGAHVINAGVSGEKIVPMCDSCNKLSSTFTLKNDITVVNANKSETCESKK